MILSDSIKKLKLPTLLFVIVLILSACNEQPKKPGGEVFDPDKFAPGAACLKESDIQSTIIASNIPNPDGNNLKTTDPNMPLYYLPGCNKNATCATTLPGDYVSTGVSARMKPIRFGTRGDVQIVEQELPPPGDGDNDAYKELRGRIYRQFCGDWCLLGLPTRGTFNCDFIYLLRPGQKKPDAQNNEADFDILIRKGAPIPEKIKCRSSAQGQAINSSGTNAQAAAPGSPDESFVQLKDGRRYFYESEEKLIKVYLSDKRLFLGKVSFRGVEYEAWFNLTSKIEEGEKILYLVLPNEVEEAIKPSSPDTFVVSYKRFRLLDENLPKGQTLQLGTFNIPKTEGWWKGWLQESKPVIYLYPEKTSVLDLKIRIDKGTVTVSDPYYQPENGWQKMLVHTNGLIEYQHSNYPYLYYETETKAYERPDFGAVVKIEDKEKYLAESLVKLGLSQRESQDFFNYWLARFDEEVRTAYLQISFFPSKTVAKADTFEVSPPVQTEIRVRAYFKPWEKPVSLKPQPFEKPPKREGFTLVEWGGILDKN